MATWIVRHIISGQTVAEHSTKKAATAQAKEMTDAHVAIDAKHEGMPVGFIPMKLEEVAPVEESPAEPEAD